jgi:hypothetical protein
VLRLWAGQAARLGFGESYRAAVLAIHNHMTDHPLSWGDPLYQLHHLDRTVYRGIHRPLQVLYAVHQARRLVFVKEFRPMTDSGLEGP